MCLLPQASLLSNQKNIREALLVSLLLATMLINLLIYRKIINYKLTIWWIARTMKHHRGYSSLQGTTSTVVCVCVSVCACADVCVIREILFPSEAACT